MAYVPVPYDPELEEGLAMFLEMVERVPLRAHTILQNREIFANLLQPIEEIVRDQPVEWWDVQVPGPDGAPEVTLTVIRPKERAATPAPAIYEIHGGGYVLGTRFFGIEALIAAAVERGTIGVSVEYRLAPENPHPAAAEDCYAGLQWVVENAGELGIDPARIVVSGFSAGGGLAAAVALMARDRQGPVVAGVYMGAPMIDDRNSTVSSYQYDGLGAWDRNNNDTGWNAALGDIRGTDRVHPYQAPARATDLADLPHTYIDVGAAEVFRDEAIDYASRIWAAGGSCELHVWSGGYHGFASTMTAKVSQAALAAKENWLSRIIGS